MDNWLLYIAVSLIALKLLGIISLSWFWVLLPFWGYHAVVLAVSVLILVAALMVMLAEIKGGK